MNQTLENFPGIKKNVVLAPYTSFHIGGPATYFYEANTGKELIEVVQMASNANVPHFILGGGTNILISDKGFDGLVIVIKNIHLEFKDNVVSVGAGVTVKELLERAQKRGLGGIEFMVGIPGSVGGAIRGNAGAYGNAIGDFGDVVQDVEVFKDGALKHFTQRQMQFSYRTSIIKLEGGLVIGARLKLIKNSPEEIKKVMDKNLEYRNKKTPNNVLSAGSVFKNIEMGRVQLDIPRIVKALDVEQEEFDEVTKYQKLPVSFINDRLGLKGKTIGKAQVSKLHGGYIINTGGATADEVIQLIAFIKTRVRDKLGILLEEEIQLVGF